MSRSYDTTINNVDVGATLTINIAEFLAILDLSYSSSSRGSMPSNQPSIFGATLSQQTPCEGASSDPTHLARLPPITAIDPTMATARRHTESLAATSRTQDRSPPSLHGPPQSDLFEYESEDLLPADQFFSSQFQDVNAWWSSSWGDSTASATINGFYLPM